MSNHVAERMPFDLSLIEVPDDLDKPKLKELLHSILKRQIVQVVKGVSPEFESDIEKFIRMVWDLGYSKGLMDMDKMHALIDGK